MLSFHYVATSSVVAWLATCLTADAAPVVNGSGDIGLRIRNDNPSTEYVSIDWAAKDSASHPELVTPNVTVQPGETTFIPVPAGASPKFYFGFSPNDRATGAKRDGDTAVEATFVGWAGHTFFDVDIEKGFSVPLWCHGEADEEAHGRGCNADLLATCDKQDAHVDALSGKVDQCRASPRNFQTWSDMCTKAYTYADDHSVTTVLQGHGEYIFTRLVALSSGAIVFIQIAR